MLAAAFLAARFVVLPIGAKLHIRPDDASPAVAEPGAGFTTWLLVGERDGGWLEVENIPGEIDLVGLGGGTPPEHTVCYAAPHGIASYRLRFFAKSSDSATVLTRDLERKSPDGTSVTLRKGLVVEPSAKGGARVRPGGLSLRLTIPKDAIGDSYEGDPDVFHSPGATLTSFPPDLADAGFRALGQKLAVDSGDVWEVEYVPMPGAKRPRHPSNETLLTSCASIRARHIAPPVAEADDEQSGFEGGEIGGVAGGIPGFLSSASPAPTPPPKLKAGTELRWPDGTKAGSVVEEQLSPPLDAKGCFPIGLSYEGGGPSDVKACPAP